MTNAPEKPTWAELAELLRWFANLFGEPADLWRDQFVSRREGLLIRGWIAALETFARALLVLMAAELPKLGANPARKARARAAASTATIDLSTGDAADELDSERWSSERWLSVAFAYAPPPRPKTPAQRFTSEPRPILPTARLALRLEAVIRVCENPGPYAARMARRLSARPRLAFPLQEGTRRLAHYSSPTGESETNEANRAEPRFPLSRLGNYNQLSGSTPLLLVAVS